jgi:Ubiquitin-activating enzyme E1 FCCH domain
MSSSGLDAVSRVTDVNGAPINGVKLKFYLGGTNYATTALVYSSPSLAVSLGNFVTASAGEFPQFFFDPALIYDARLEDSGGALIKAIPNISVPVEFTAVQASIAALRAATWPIVAAPRVVTTLYDHYAGDGGAAWWLDSADVATLDDGGMVIVTASGARYKRLGETRSSPLKDARDFAVRGNGVTDAFAGFTKLIAFERADATYKSVNAALPKGEIITSVGLSFSPDVGKDFITNLRLAGAGQNFQDIGTRLSYTGATGALHFLSATNVELEGFNVHTAAAMDRLVNFNAAGAVPYYSGFLTTLRRMRFSAAVDPSRELVRFANVQQFEVRESNFTGATNVMTLGSNGISRAVTNVTKANPAVVTCNIAGIADHGYENGETVYITGVVGMVEINDRAFVVANRTATTFELAGENSTGHTAYASGGIVRLSQNVGTFGNGAFSNSFVHNCWLQGDVRANNLQTTTFSCVVFGDHSLSGASSKFKPYGDQYERAIGFVGCWFGEGGASGNAYEQGANGKGLLFERARLHATWDVGVKLSNGYAIVDNLWLTMSKAGAIGVEIAAGAKQVQLGPIVDEMVGAGAVAVLDRRATMPEWAPTQPIINASHEHWQAGTSFVPGATTHMADGYKGKRGAAAAGATYSKQVGFLGARSCMRVQRDNGNAALNALFYAQQIASEDCQYLAGQTISFCVDARSGANFSGGTLAAYIYTGTGWNEAGDPVAGFATGNALHVLAPQAIAAGAARIVFPGVAISAAATEIMVAVFFTPTGTAGASDYVELTNFKLGAGYGDGRVHDMFRARASHDDLAAVLDRYRKSFAALTAPAQNAGLNSGEYSFPAITAGATAQRPARVEFGRPMIAAPTMTGYNPAAANAQARDLTAAADCSATAFANITPKGFNITCTGAAGTAAGNGIGIHFVADARL